MVLFSIFEVALLPKRNPLRQGKQRINNCEQLCFMAITASLRADLPSWVSEVRAERVTRRQVRPRPNAKDSGNYPWDQQECKRATESQTSGANQLCRQQRDLCLIWFHYRAHNCEKSCTLNKTMHLCRSLTQKSEKSHIKLPKDIMWNYYVSVPHFISLIFSSVGKANPFGHVQGGVVPGLMRKLIESGSKRARNSGNAYQLQQPASSNLQLATASN